MKMLQTLLVIGSVLVVLAETVHVVQARSGPLAFYPTENQNLQRHLLSNEAFDSDTEILDVSKRNAGRVDTEEDLDAGCVESGSSEKRRLVLADSIDYKDDGPNNPITDPPHD